MSFLLFSRKENYNCIIQVTNVIKYNFLDNIKIIENIWVIAI